MTCYAIQRPDGSIVAAAGKEETAWWFACELLGHAQWVLERMGYKCVRVTVTVEEE